jgi:hypothetical protein
MSSLPIPSSDVKSATVPAERSLQRPAALRVGNRQVVTDHYFATSVSDEPQLYQNKVFVRLGASKGTVFRKVSFTHCVFDACYLASCTFDSCDFTGCRFLGSNFHQSSFAGCKFWYATFERTQIDDDILIAEAPSEENLRMRFARTLRMNFTQLGDAKAVNRAISLELEATELYLRKSWSPNRGSYYRKKYPGVRQLAQFFRWSEFKLLDFVWGNGESILKLLRTLAIVLVLIAVYDVTAAGRTLDLAAYWTSVKDAPAIFLGVQSKTYSTVVLSLIAASRYVGLALMTALLVKRFGRR